MNTIIANDGGRTKYWKKENQKKKGKKENQKKKKGKKENQKKRREKKKKKGQKRFLLSARTYFIFFSIISIHCKNEGKKS